MLFPSKRLPCLIHLSEADISAVSWMLEYEHVRKPSLKRWAWDLSERNVWRVLSENCGRFYDSTWRGYWDTTKYRDMRYVIPRPICDGVEVPFGRVWGQKNITCTYHWWIPSILWVLPFESLEHAHLNSHEDIVRMQTLRLNANCND